MSTPNRSRLSVSIPIHGPGVYDSQFGPPPAPHTLSCPADVGITHVFQETDILDHGAEPSSLLVETDDTADTLLERDTGTFPWTRPVGDLEWRQNLLLDLAFGRIKGRSRVRPKAGVGTERTGLADLSSRPETCAGRDGVGMLWRRRRAREVRNV